MIGPTEIHSAKILIVDDKEANVVLLERALRGAGYAAITSTMDPEQVCGLHKDNQFDLILLDLMMPKIDGIEVCKRLRADPGFPFTPIIIVTAMADLKDVVAGLEAGGDEYLTKPIKVKEFNDTLNAALEAADRSAAQPGGVS